IEVGERNSGVELNQLLTIYFFFFQAEDGIRDRNVTGVQTCALPICHMTLTFYDLHSKLMSYGQILVLPSQMHHISSFALEYLKRSEERRVGKECRYQGAQYHGKKVCISDIGRAKSRQETEECG